MKIFYKVTLCSSLFAYILTLGLVYHSDALIPFSRMVRATIFSFKESPALSRPSGSIQRPSTLIMNSAKKFQQLIPTKPEFSRIVNVAQIPSRKPIVCKLLANDEERRKLAARLDLIELSYFSANVTISRQDSNAILVEGSFIARSSNGGIFPDEEYASNFDTLILDNTNSIGEALSLDDATDFDDEVAGNGDIDIGEIASQFLSLEIY